VCSSAKMLSASGGFDHLSPHQGLWPWTPVGGSARTPVIGSRSRARHWGVSPPWYYILAPPLCSESVIINTCRQSMVLFIQSSLDSTVLSFLSIHCFHNNNRSCDSRMISLLFWFTSSLSKKNYCERPMWLQCIMELLLVAFQQTP